MIGDKGTKKIWVYNAGVDKRWQDSSFGVRKVNDLKEQLMFNRQGEIVLFLANRNDIVFLAQEPDEEFVHDIEVLGFEKPSIYKIPDMDMPISEYLLNNLDIMHGINHLKSYLYMPYILSEFDETICKQLNIPIYGSTAQTVKNINDKMNSKRIAEHLGLPVVKGYFSKNKNELMDAQKKLKEQGVLKFAIKEPFNSAGKGVYFIRDERQFNSFVRMMRFANDEKFEVVIEEWIDNKKDINYQIEICASGEVKLLSITEQIVDVTSYKGTIYPANITDDQEKTYKKYTEIIGQELFRLGYRGLVGIDSMIKEDGEIIPVIEFNARLNQSTFYLPIMQKISKGNYHMLIRSYDIQTNLLLNYAGLKKILKEKGMLYSEEKKEGIIILNSACLSAYRDKKYHSRLFLGIVFENGDQVKDKYETVDEFVKTLQVL